MPKTNYFVSGFGQSAKAMARYMRFWVGHFPYGAFRARFNLEGKTLCTYCGLFEPEGQNVVIETRDHILYECKGWACMIDPTSKGLKQVLPKPSITHRLMFESEYWQEAMQENLHSSAKYEALRCADITRDLAPGGGTNHDAYWEA